MQNNHKIDLLIEKVLSESIKFYHVAPNSVYNSIKKYGLDPSKASYDRSTSGNEIYVFKTLKLAQWYKNFMENQPPINKMNIWQINGENLAVKKDYGLSNEETEDSYILKAPISKEKLKFIE